MNYEEKSKKLENDIVREVQDFHPVLRELFTRMESFTKVDYTQGNQEFGADFVLESVGNFGDEEYTGVVVKVGKITQKDLPEISRQIEECFVVPRYVNNGLKEILINKIVVVTNGTISNQAKKVVHAKFKGNAINFISKIELVPLINKYYDEYWKDSRVLLNLYFDDLNEKCEKLLIGNSQGYQSTTEYVDIRIKRKEINNQKIKLSNLRKVNSLSKALDISNLILLEGGMGSGKSALVANHVLKSIEDFKESKTECIPVIIEFSDYQNDLLKNLDNDITSVLDRIESDIENPNLIVFLDGFDEYYLEVDERKEFIIGLYEIIKKYQSFKFILTTREIEDYEFDVFLDKYFDLYKICPLQNNQIMAIVQSYYKPGKNVRSDISNLQLFNMLPKTPMTAILLGQILSHDPKEIPSTLTELYSKFTEIVLFRWSGDNLQSQTEYEIFKNVCGIFSKYLLDYNLTTVSMGELKEIIDEYLSERNLDIDKNKIFEKLAYNNEIFITNYKANTIRFKHRSFCEFFYARALFQNKSYKMNKDIYNPYWQNAYFFVFGLIKDSSDLINSLSEIEFDSYGLKINQVATNAQFLLAAYVSPYTAIENQLDHSINIAANTVLEILNDPAEAETLKSLDMGRIELMIFMCIVISQCYSYDFFDKALRNIGDTITGDTKEFSDTDWLKLLFISATLAVKGDSQYIDIIAKNYVEKKIHLDNDQLSILLNLIYSNNFEINSSTRQFLKLYRRRVPKSSNLNKTIDLLSKGKREDARIFNNSNR